MRCQSTTARKKTLILTGPLLTPLLASTGLLNTPVISLKDTSRIDRLFAELINEAEKPISTPCHLSELSYAVLMTLAEQLVFAPRPEELQKALRFIQRSLSSTLSLTELAEYANVSKATLNRLFKEYMHCSPINYFIERKLANAMQLLQHYPVKQVAAMLNYPSAQYFSKEFKKHFGISPKQSRTAPADEKDSI